MGTGPRKRLSRPASCAAGLECGLAPLLHESKDCSHAVSASEIGTTNAMLLGVAVMLMVAGKGESSEA